MIHTSTQLKALVVKSDAGLMEQWQIYQRKYDYAADYHWEDIVTNIERLFGKLNYEQNLR